MAITYETVLRFKGGTQVGEGFGDYIYEPHLIKLTSDDTLVKELKFAGIIFYKPDGTGSDPGVTDYARISLDGDGSAIIDIHKLLRPLVEKDIYKIGEVSDITWETIMSKNWYQWSVYEILPNGTTGGSSGSYNIPLHGGRQYKNLEDLSRGLLPTGETKVAWLTDWDYNGIKQPEWIGQPIISSDLPPYFGGGLNVMDLRPIVTITTPVTGRNCCGAYLIWKSQYGGWNSYGFDIYIETDSLKYEGKLGGDPLGVVSETAGANPYIKPNYTEVSTTSKSQLKTVGVPQAEARVLQSLNNSPAVFLKRLGSDKLELMRLNSTSIPLSNLTNGVTVSVSLSSIGEQMQNAR